MSFLMRSSSSDTKKTMPLEEQQAKINEVRELVDPNLSTTMPNFFSDASIARFLRVRNWNVQKASKMMNEAAKWRLEYKPDKIRWEDVAHATEHGKIYRADYCDKLGRTVLVMRPGVQDTSSNKENLRCFIYFLENAIMNLPADQEQIVWLVDFQRWTMSSTPLKLSLQSIHVLQAYYPDILGLAIAHNPPGLFESFWKIVKPFSEKQLREKLKFIYSDKMDSQNVMPEFFDMDKVESAYGGKNPVVFDFNICAARMREDDKKLDALLSSNGDLGSAGHQQSSPLVTEEKPE